MIHTRPSLTLTGFALHFSAGVGLDWIALDSVEKPAVTYRGTVQYKYSKLTLPVHDRDLKLQAYRIRFYLNLILSYPILSCPHPCQYEIGWGGMDDGVSPVLCMHGTDS